MRLEHPVTLAAAPPRSSIVDHVTQVLVETLGIQDRAHVISADTSLFGALPELDSLGIVELGLALETHFGFEMVETDFTAETFETVGALAQFVERKKNLAAR